MNRFTGLLLATIMLTSLSFGDAFGRGFGGFRGGGIGGGERFGGGFGGGERFGGGFGGGVRSGGGFAGDRFGGGFGGERFGGERRSSDSGQVTRGDRFGGDAGGRFSNGGFRDNGGMPRRQNHQSDSGQRSSGDRWSNRGGSDGMGNGNVYGMAQSELNKFLGMPTDAGLSSMTSTRVRAGRVEGQRGDVDATRVTAGRVEGSRGDVDATRVTAGRVEGPRGNSAAFVSGTHIGYVSPSVRNAQAIAVRNAYYGPNLFTRGWYRNHPNAWAAAGVAAAAWTAATWSGVSNWLDCDSQPQDYDYGSTVIYQGNTVYVEGQPAGTPDQYYSGASSLADSGATQPSDQSKWMALGVFALVQGTQTDPTMIFQLAVNHQGIIKGNFINTMTNSSLPVHGAVDKKTQRVAWTVGDNKTTVFDTGLYNLTKDQAPALVHFGKNRTQEWLLVRLKNQNQQQNDS
jgi:hypothetical protein